MKSDLRPLISGIVLRIEGRRKKRISEVGGQWAINKTINNIKRIEIKNIYGKYKY
jgi:hypothetical protein